MSLEHIEIEIRTESASCRLRNAMTSHTVPKELIRVETKKLRRADAKGMTPTLSLGQYPMQQLAEVPEPPGTVCHIAVGFVTLLPGTPEDS
jgi:hypothetical protein